MVRYEGAAAQKPDADEYLLGKQHVDTDSGTGEVKKLLKGEVPGSTWLARPKATEEFNRMNEDPLTRMYDIRVYGDSGGCGSGVAAGNVATHPAANSTFDHRSVCDGMVGRAVGRADELFLGAYG